MPAPQLPPFINAQRVVALALLVLECAVVVMFARTIVFPAVVLTLAIFGFATRWRVKFDRKLTFNLAVFVWLALLAQYGLLPANPRYNELFSGGQVAYLIAQFLMSVQAAYFFVLRPDNLLPQSFALLGAGALASLAIVQLRMNYERPVLQALHALFVVGALLFWSHSRRLTMTAPRWYSGRSLLAGLTAILIAVSGCGVAWAMARYESQLDRWVMSLLDFEKPTTDVGFAETSRIGAVRFSQSQNANQIALRVTAESEPGYFRGKVYDSYFDNEWHFAPSGLPIERVASLPGGLSTNAEDGTLLRLVNASGLLQSMTVQPGKGMTGIYFAPLETAYLQTRRNGVTRDQHNVLRSDERIAASYRLFVTSGFEVGMSRRSIGRSRDVAPELDELLFVPRTLRENSRVLELRDRLFRNATTTRAKIAAVENYFSSYRYGLEATPPRDRDPIEWFLIEKPAAHCEYFGSATVMLLRLGGVPSRYVTGFVVDERNAISGEYVARNKDAHAWAEVRLDDGRWETLETTPSSGRPSQNGPSESSDVWEALTALLEHWKQQLLERGVAAVMQSLLQPVVTFVAVAALLGVIVFGVRQYRRSRTERPKPLYPMHALEAELLQHDRKLSRHFRPRDAHETLSQYAAALERAATSETQPPSEIDLKVAALWYRDYERRRFAS